MAKRKIVSKKDKAPWKPTGRAYAKRTEKPESLNKGDVVQGRILAIQAGAQSPVLVVKEDETDKTRRLWMPTILQNSITLDDVGDFVAIHCKGKTHTKAGRELIDFDVFIAEAEDGEPDVSDDDIPPDTDHDN